MFVLATDSTMRFLVAILMIAAPLAPRLPFSHVARCRSRLSHDYSPSLQGETDSSPLAPGAVQDQALPASVRVSPTQPSEVHPTVAEPIDHRSVSNASSPRFQRRPLEDLIHAAPRLLRLRF